MSESLPHFVFPADPLDPRAIDEYFAPQRDALNAAGFGTSVLPRGIPVGATVVYRGWMLDTDEYRGLVATIGRANATPLTSLDHYLLTHHLPNWYPLLRDLTPETVVFPEDVDLVAELKALGWPGVFLKDYVKSLKTSAGSLVTDVQSAPAVVADMRKYRGTIEGGICVRRVETLTNEQRFFVVQGKAHGKSIPPIVHDVTERISSPFFSVDVATNEHGSLRVVEIGDGQVSDLVGWTVEEFVDLWRLN